MRFAGSRIEGFLGDTPDYGGLASGSSRLKSKEDQAITGLMGKTAATGISAAGKVKAAEITGAAEQAMARTQRQSAMMGMIGKIGASGITAAGDAGLFGGGGTPTMKWDSSGSGLGYNSTQTGAGYGFSDLPTDFTW
jgi:hypothetical protein